MLEAVHGQERANDSAGAGAETPAEVPPRQKQDKEDAAYAALNVGGTTRVYHALVPLVQGTGALFYPVRIHRAPQFCGKDAAAKTKFAPSQKPS